MGYFPADAKIQQMTVSGVTFCETSSVVKFAFYSDIPAWLTNRCQKASSFV